MQGKKSDFKQTGKRTLVYSKRIETGRQSVCTLIGLQWGKSVLGNSLSSTLCMAANDAKASLAMMWILQIYFCK